MANLVTNGTFAAWTLGAPDDWAVTGTVTEDSGKAQITDGADADSRLRQTILTIGKTYRATLDITDVSAGGVWVGSSVGAEQTYLSSVATHVVYFTTSTTIFNISGAYGPSTDVTIDNVAVYDLADINTVTALTTSDGWIYNGFITDATQSVEVIGAQGTGKYIVMRELRLSAPLSARAFIASAESATATATTYLGPLMMDADGYRDKFEGCISMKANEGLYLRTSAISEVQMFVAGYTR